MTHSNPSDFTETWNRLAQKVFEQQWPKGALYVVATPIGNLGDLSLRAWHALTQCDVIAAEDTRTSRALLDAWGISIPLIAAHRHNEADAAHKLVERLKQGERVGLISDAGAPAVSDPGARIVRAVRNAGHPVIAIPGPSAVITSLMASGATSDENPAFVFAGFAPSKSSARQKWMRRWTSIAAPIVMFESPYRVVSAVQDLVTVCGPERVLTIARELTKRFEEVATMPLGHAADWLGKDAHRTQGEFVLIVHEDTTAGASDEIDASVYVLLDALLESVSVRDAARIAAKVTGLPRDVLYTAALERKR